MFPGMNEYQFATFFIVVKQEQIKQELKTNILHMDIVIKSLYKFIVKNKKYILAKFTTQYDSLNDKEFFTSVINILKTVNNI